MLCLAALLAASAVQAQTSTLVTNLSQATSDTVFVISPNIGVTWNAIGQQFETGSYPNGYLIDSVEISVGRGDSDGEPELAIFRMGDGPCGEDGALSNSFANVVDFDALDDGATSSTGKKTIAAPSDTVLLPNQCYYLWFVGNNDIQPDIHGSGGLKLRTTESTSVDMASQMDWAIVGPYLERRSRQIVLVPDGPRLKIGINGTPYNEPPVFTEASAAFTAPENQSAVGSVEASDDNAEDSVTGYAITGGADRGPVRHRRHDRRAELRHASGL